METWRQRKIPKEVKSSGNWCKTVLTELNFKVTIFDNVKFAKSLKLAKLLKTESRLALAC